MVTIKHTRESIAELEKELNHYKTAHDKLTAGLKEAVAESIQYKRERDESNKEVVRVMEKLIVSEDTAEDYKFGYREIKKQRDELIEDVEKLRNALIKTQNLADELMDIQVKYIDLTQHIKLKAENNPNVSRYINLVLYIDELEGD